MEQKNYKLPRNCDDFNITATARKYFPHALHYCQEHGISACKVNRISFWFDFATSTVRINGPMDEGHWWKYQMIEC